MKNILIQPTLLTYDKYSAFAKQHGLQFEIVDFANPKTLNADLRPLIDAYKTKPESSPPSIVGQHGAFIDLYINSPDQLIKEVSEKQVMKNLDISEQLNIRYTIFHSNIVTLIGHKFYYDNWVQKHTEFWNKIIRQYKTTVLLENMWDQSPDLLLQVIKQVGEEQLKICFDTGHCNIFSKAPMREWFRKMGSEISYIHLNDNKGDIDSELPPGEGTVDWKEFSSLVGEYCHEPVVVLEVGSLDRIKKSIDYLQENRIYPYN